MTVSYQWLRALVGIGEEQSPADEPISQRLDEFQSSLDIAGLAPVYGNAADIVNAVISIFRGHYVDAALSAGAVIPVVGQGITSVKIARAASQAEERATQIHGVLKGQARSRRTTAVVETEEGIRVVASSERRLDVNQRAKLVQNEMEGVGFGHAELTGIKAAREAGLTPIGVAASRPICLVCAAEIKSQGIEALSPLK